METMKIWESPKTVVQSFEAQEYVAACGDQNKVYKFVCDADAGTLYYYENSTAEAERVGNYSPCAKTHETSVSDTYYDGFVDYNNNQSEDADEKVKVWLEWSWLPVIGSFISNGHATKNVNMNTWETAKS